MSYFSESLRVAVVILVGLGLVGLCLRRKSAALRNQAHRILIVAAWATPVIGSFFALLPQVPVATISPSAVRAAPTWIPKGVLPKEAYVVRTPPEARFRASVDAEDRTFLLLFGIYFAGMAFSFLGLARGIYRFGLMASRAQLLSDKEGIRVLRSIDPDLHVPVTMGRVILLPAASVEWPDSRIEASIAHEKAHVGRKDSTWQLLAQVFCMTNWYNPAAYLLARALRASAEEAADDAVLASGIRPSEYAAELLAVAQDFSSFRTAAVAMVGRHGLKRRLHLIIAENRDRRRVTAPRTIAAALLLGSLTLALGAVSTRMPSQTLAPIPGATVLHKGQVGTLPDGSTVSLTSVQLIEKTRVAAWDVTGSPLPPIEPMGTYFDVHGKPKRELMFNFDLRSRGTKPYANYLFPKPFPGNRNMVVPIDGSQGQYRLSVQTVDVTGSFGTDLAVGLATEPWIQSPQTLAPTEINVNQSDVREFEVFVPVSVKENEVMVIPFSDKGRSLASDVRSGGFGERPDGRQGVTFDIRLRPGEKIGLVRFSYRPYRWLVFKDVCIQPSAQALAEARRPELQKMKWTNGTTYVVTGLEKKR